MIAWLLILLACSQPSAPSVDAVPAHGRACQATGPDVVIISIDTTRADRLGFSGHPGASTPRIDALATRGRVYANAIAPVPRTTPALASVMTGLAPHHHGAREVGEKMLAPLPLASLLTQAGWRAVGISAMPVAGPDQHMDRGFDHFEVHYDAPAPQLAETALRRSAEIDRSCPLFLWTHFADPHFPYTPPAAFKPAGDTARCEAVAAKAAAGKLARYRYFGDRDGRSRAIKDQCAQLYDGEIAFADHGVGRLLDGLAALGRTDPIVIFTADHGENLGEWGLYFEHGPNAHDASVRVPLILAGPGVDAGKVDIPVTLEDIAPTVLALTGIERPESLQFDGQSLLSPPEERRSVVRGESGSALHARLTGNLVAGRKDRLHCIHGERFSLCDHPKKRRRLFDRTVDPDLREDVSSSHPAQVQALGTAWEAWPVERTRQRFVRTSTHVLVATPQLDGTYTNRLYNHQTDPTLSTDVATAHSDVMAELMKELEIWHGSLDRANTAPPTHAIDQENALRSLGYIE